MKLTGVEAVAFDVNGTLVDIRTEEHREDAFRAVGHYLNYQGIHLRRQAIHDMYFARLKQQQRDSPEEFPEFDAVAIWGSIVVDHATDYTHALPPDRIAALPQTLAELYRGVSRHKLKRYPHVRSTLGALCDRYPLAVVSDGQKAYARAELHKVDLTQYFGPIVVSGEHGFRKPDRRLFQYALDAMGVPAEKTVYVGNDMYRDVYGAREMGMRTVMFDSDQGTKVHQDCRPDFTITDHRDLLAILGG
ncbi:HAD family hydrolase [Mycolicibacterium hodleri]|uniref:HAD family hydrolase n=1 Tax=Mycolicibacterium hodleri TaxID=49897 RepID=A0A502EHU4_9MYCO|nr:HAD family hydrolase [Mycolicibacterium hodleri]TPG36714.1 HAD family hydrolase [Mycolicibacterium hodleri]